MSFLLSGYSIRVQGLLLRVLYRLRSLSEREPLDPASLTLASIMLSAVVSAGGMGAASTDEALEQVALVVDIISFHCPSCASFCALPLIGFGLTRCFCSRRALLSPSRVTAEPRARH